MPKDKIAVLVKKIIDKYSDHMKKLENQQNEAIDAFVLGLEEKKKEKLRKEINR